MRLVFVASVWFDTVGEPQSREVWGDGFEWYIDDDLGIGMMCIDDAMGWVIDRVEVPRPLVSGHLA